MKPLILIVEDEPAIADNIKYALSTEGFDTKWHNCGGGVLAFLSAHKVALIVLDIGLPDINGLELCKKIRRQTNIPIIFLTARADEIDRIVGLEIGGDDYMVKPFSPRELSARVKAVLRRTTTEDKAPAAPAEASAFATDHDRRRITFFKSALDLSRYEFEILSIFISRPGRIFSREKLMEMAWENPDMSMDRTIDSHIKNIRTKLRKIRPGIEPIQTHRGIGYSLKENL